MSFLRRTGEEGIGFMESVSAKTDNSLILTIKCGVSLSLVLKAWEVHWRSTLFLRNFTSFVQVIVLDCEKCCGVEINVEKSVFVFYMTLICKSDTFTRCMKCPLFGFIIGMHFMIIMQTQVTMETVLGRLLRQVDIVIVKMILYKQDMFGTWLQWGSVPIVSFPTTGTVGLRE